MERPELVDFVEIALYLIFFAVYRFWRPPCFKRYASYWRPFGPRAFLADRGGRHRILRRRIDLSRLQTRATASEDLGLRPRCCGDNLDLAALRSPDRWRSRKANSGSGRSRHSVRANRKPPPPRLSDFLRTSARTRAFSELDFYLRASGERDAKTALACSWRGREHKLRSLSASFSHANGPHDHRLDVSLARRRLYMADHFHRVFRLSVAWRMRKLSLSGAAGDGGREASKKPIGPSSRQQH